MAWIAQNARRSPAFLLNSMPPRRQAMREGQRILSTLLAGWELRLKTLVAAPVGITGRAQGEFLDPSTQSTRLAIAMHTTQS